MTKKWKRRKQEERRAAQSASTSQKTSQSSDEFQADAGKSKPEAVVEDERLATATGNSSKSNEFIKISKNEEEQTTLKAKNTDVSYRSPSKKRRPRNKEIPKSDDEFEDKAGVGYDHSLRDNKHEPQRSRSASKKSNEPDTSLETAGNDVPTIKKEKGTFMKYQNTGKVQGQYFSSKGQSRGSYANDRETQNREENVNRRGRKGNFNKSENSSRYSNRPGHSSERNYAHSTSSWKNQASGENAFGNWKSEKAENVSPGWVQPKNTQTPKDVLNYLKEAAEEKENEEFKEFNKNWKTMSFNKIIEKNLDLFCMPEDYSLGHCVAEDLVMGAGIALQFRRTFNGLEELHSQNQKPGGLAVLKSGQRFVYYLVTKYISTRKPTHIFMWKSLHKLKQHVIANNVKKLALPRIGCGLDGMNWNYVKNMLGYIFQEVDVELCICTIGQEHDKNDGLKQGKLENFGVKLEHAAPNRGEEQTAPSKWEEYTGASWEEQAAPGRWEEQAAPSRWEEQAASSRWEEQATPSIWEDPVVETCSLNLPKNEDTDSYTENTSSNDNNDYWIVNNRGKESSVSTVESYVPSDLQPVKKENTKNYRENVNPNVASRNSRDSSNSKIAESEERRTSLRSNYERDSSNSEAAKVKERRRSPSKYEPRDENLAENTQMQKTWNSKRNITYDKSSSKEKLDADFDKFQSMIISKLDFKFIKVKEIQADLFTMSEEYALGHCVAEDLNMGSGIAVQFRQQFKKVDELLNQRQRQGGLAILNVKNRYIYYLVTKRTSSGKPTYFTFWKSLQEMKKHVSENKVKKLALPRIGCGLDGLEWSHVKSMLEYIFTDVDVEITICNFQQDSNSVHLSRPPPKHNKIVNDPRVITELEEWSTIIYLGSEDGYVTNEIKSLDKKFGVESAYKRGNRRVGETIRTDKESYVLYGFIVKKKKDDPFCFTNFQKCLNFVQKSNAKDKYEFIGIQAFEDNNDNLIMSKLVNLMRNTLTYVEIYICWPPELHWCMPKFA